MGRKLTANQGECRMLIQRHQYSLKEDRRCRVRRAGEEIESLVARDQLKEVWIKNQRWYQVANGHQAPPTSKQLGKP